MSLKRRIHFDVSEGRFYLWLTGLSGAGKTTIAVELEKRLHAAPIRVADKRSDAHYKLAHELCNSFDTLIFEDLNIAGMKALWGRKVSDLAFGKFMQRVKHVAARRGKRVIQINRFERTTGKCWGCKHEQSLDLRERTFICQHCGLTIRRDHNAAINTRLAGASAATSREVVSRILKRCAALPEARSPRVYVWGVCHKEHKAE
jgi:transposase